MTLEAIKAADDRFQVAAQAAETVREERNNRIRLAVQDGVSMTEIARAIGVSRARVAQIVERGQ